MLLPVMLDAAQTEAQAQEALKSVLAVCVARDLTVHDQLWEAMAGAATRTRGVHINAAGVCFRLGYPDLDTGVSFCGFGGFANRF